MDRLDVKFPCAQSKYSNCLCTCCHGTGQVVKVKMPETLYFDGKKLSTRYSDLWLCESCTQELVRALQEPKTEE